jgi:uncharacterized protein
MSSDQVSGPSGLHIVDLAQVPLQPWRNGGGVTQELLAWPDAAHWACRVSVARIERDGPFSAFPGVQRWFTVLRGEGVRLQLPGQGVVMRLGSAPLCFEGSWAPSCELVRGPTEDLNFMLRTEAGVGSMVLATTDSAWTCAASWRAVFCLDAAELIREGQAAIALPARSLAWSDNAACERWQLRSPRSSSRAWWMHFQHSATVESA